MTASGRAYRATDRRVYNGALCSAVYREQQEAEADRDTWRLRVEQ